MIQWSCPSPNACAATGRNAPRSILYVGRFCVAQERKEDSRAAYCLFCLSPQAASQIGHCLLGVVQRSWRENSVEASVLSRRCSEEFARLVEHFCKLGGEPERLRLRLVRDRNGGRLGSNLSHIVLTWDTVTGVRAATMRCMCGAVENPDYHPWRAPR